MMIYRLLKDLDPASYCVISSEDYSASAGTDGYTRRLDARYHHLPAEKRIRRGSRWRSIRDRVNIQLMTRERARNIAEIVRREGCEAIIACTGGADLLDLPAALLASRMTGARFIPFILDYFSHQWKTWKVWKTDDDYADALEGKLLKAGDGIIGLNEFLLEDIRKRHGVTGRLVRNPVDLIDYPATPDPQAPDEDDLRIVFTGSIYAAHYDAFRNLLAAMKMLNRPGVRLHVYTEQPPEKLAEQGISGPIVFHAHEKLSAMPSVQRQADILFLPLAFTSPYPDIVRTSAPTKTGEYLASHRPILVHSPADSWLSWYFREYDCGMVVDKSDPAELARALAQLLDDADLRRRLTANAWRRAEDDFNLDVAREHFLNLLGAHDAYSPRLVALSA
jgi:glycosyltransferase involved in cell wall biosynthesis